MKETGLMFKAPLVRAILEGRKTKTRRIVKWKDLQKGLNLGFSGLRADKTGDNWVLESNTPTSSEWRCTPTPCPFGKPGDRIYVRETFAHFERTEDFKEGCECFYRADGDCVDLQPWRPAIHMPKHAARIWLEITGVRVERLQEMSQGDAVRDGGLHQLPATGRYVINKGDQYLGLATHNPVELFQEIWDSNTSRPVLPANKNSKRYARVKHWLDTPPTQPAGPQTLGSGSSTSKPSALLAAQLEYGEHHHEQQNQHSARNPLGCQRVRPPRSRPPCHHRNLRG